MTAILSGATIARRRDALVDHVRRRDVGFATLRRATRAALLVPPAFAAPLVFTKNVDAALFSAFGLISMLIFVGFTGSFASRMRAQAFTVGTGTCLVALGSLCSTHLWLAVSSTLVATFMLLFVGAASPSAAAAGTPLVISFVLPATLPFSTHEIWYRSAAWFGAGLISLLAIRWLWPAPARDPLRDKAAAVASLLATALRADVACVTQGGTTGSRNMRVAARARAREGAAALHELFLSTAYRPAGLTISSQALVGTVDLIIWLGSVVDEASLGDVDSPEQPAACTVRLMSAQALDTAAARLVDQPRSDATAPVADLADALVTLRQAAEDAADNYLHATANKAPVSHSAELDLFTPLQFTFQAQEIGYAAEVIARTTSGHDNSVRSGNAQASFALGGGPQGPHGVRVRVGRQLRAHLDWKSVWLRNSSRAAMAFAASVALADWSGVQHAFWVVFGTLAALRTTALSTGQTALRAVAGTVVGTAIGLLIALLVGHNPAALWALLPASIFFMGFAPAVISFVAGQAGFTMTLIIMFSLFEPTGWQLGLVRIEDMLLGAAVSVIVALLVWPRGASVILRNALAHALAAVSGYLTIVVRSSQEGQRNALGDAVHSPATAASVQATAAMERVDVALRGFLAEGGTKQVSLPDLVAMNTSLAVLRLTADAVHDLWLRPPTAQETSDAMDADLLPAALAIEGWYGHAALALLGADQLPQPMDSQAVLPAAREATASVGQRAAGHTDLDHRAARRARTIWTLQHLGVAVRAQSEVHRSVGVLTRGLPSRPGGRPGAGQRLTTAVPLAAPSASGTLPEGDVPSGVMPARRRRSPRARAVTKGDAAAREKSWLSRRRRGPVEPDQQRAQDGDSP